MKIRQMPKDKTILHELMIKSFELDNFSLDKQKKLLLVKTNHLKHIDLQLISR